LPTLDRKCKGAGKRVRHSESISGTDGGGRDEGKFASIRCGEKSVKIPRDTWEGQDGGGGSNSPRRLGGEKSGENVPRLWSVKVKNNWGEEARNCGERHAGREEEAPVFCYG